MVELPIWAVLFFVLGFLFLCLQMTIVYISTINKQQDIIFKQIELMQKIMSINKNNFLNNNSSSSVNNMDNKTSYVENENAEDTKKFSEITLDEASLILSDKFNKNKLDKNFEGVGSRNEYENEQNSEIVDKLKGIKNVDNN